MHSWVFRHWHLCLPCIPSLPVSVMDVFLLRHHISHNLLHSSSKLISCMKICKRDLPLCKFRATTKSYAFYLHYFISLKLYLWSCIHLTCAFILNSYHMHIHLQNYVNVILIWKVTKNVCNHIRRQYTVLYQKQK